MKTVGLVPPCFWVCGTFGVCSLANSRIWGRNHGGNAWNSMVRWYLHQTQGGRGTENKLTTLYMFHSCFICVTWQIYFKQTARAVVQGPAFNIAVIRAENKLLSAEHTPGIKLGLIKI